MTDVSTTSASTSNLLTYFGFNLAFFVGLGAGFILGIIGSYIGNYFWERHKKNTRGKKPFMNVTADGDMIQIEGQFENKTQTQVAVSKTLQAIFPIEKK
jgi:hypothetical protein